MAYEPLNLQNGQTLTAEDLQHMEQGIAGVLPQNPGAYQYPATDGDGNMVWADRLAYEESGTIKTIDPKFLSVFVNLNTLTKEQAVEYATQMAHVAAVKNNTFYPVVNYKLTAASAGDDCCGCGPQSASITLYGDNTYLEEFDITSDEYEQIASTWGLS